MAFQYLDRLAHQQGVAVPADAAGTRIERDRPVIAVRFEQLHRERAGAGPETPVGLLKRDDVGAELVENVDRPFGTAAPVGPDGLSDIVTGYADHRGSAVASRVHPRKPGLKSMRPFIFETAERMIQGLGRLVGGRRDRIL